MKLHYILIASGVVTMASSAGAQTVTCNTYGTMTTCTQSPTFDMHVIDQSAYAPPPPPPAQQQQVQPDPLLTQLGSAMAARREKKQIEQTRAAMDAALLADPQTQLPVPTDEQPILLTCISNGEASTLALYEKHGRVDSTGPNGKTSTRKATFTNASVSWNTALWQASLNRLTGSIVAYGSLPQFKGQSLKGQCAIATRPVF